MCGCFVVIHVQYFGQEQSVLDCGKKAAATAVSPNLTPALLGHSRFRKAPPARFAGGEGRDSNPRVVSHHPPAEAGRAALTSGDLSARSSIIKIMPSNSVLPMPSPLATSPSVARFRSFAGTDARASSSHAQSLCIRGKGLPQALKKRDTPQPYDRRRPKGITRG